MKVFLRIFIVSIFFFTGKNIVVSQTIPSYTLTAANFNRSAPDSLVFNIYLRHTNPDPTYFEYCSGQYMFNFNPLISNGGTLTYRMLDSDLPIPFRPRNPAVSGNQLRLSMSTICTQQGYYISSAFPGTLIARMSLKTSASSFDPNQTLNLSWRHAPQPSPKTLIFVYTGIVLTDITNPQFHFIDSTITHTVNSEGMPLHYSLSQNYPNPFNPKTIINYSFPTNKYTTLKVFDILGKQIAILVNEKQNAGSYSVEFDGSKLSSGVYYYKLEAGDYTQVRKMILQK